MRRALFVLSLAGMLGCFSTFLPGAPSSAKAAEIDAAVVQPVRYYRRPILGRVARGTARVVTGRPYYGYRGYGYGGYGYGYRPYGWGYPGFYGPGLGVGVGVY